MDLTQLRTFVAVAQESHMTKAAERLHLSQPAASAHIKALEDEFGFRLFERTNKGLVLTPKGTVLFKKAEMLLAQASEIKHTAMSMGGAAIGRVVLASSADPTFNRVGELIAWARSNEPLLEFSVEVRSSLATKRGIELGEVTCGFLVGTSVGSGLSAMRLKNLTYRVVAPQLWAARVAAPDKATLLSLPWVGTSAGTSNYEMRRSLFDDADIPTAVEVNSDLLVRALVAANVGIGLIREDFAMQGASAGTYALVDAPPVSTSLLFVYPTQRAGDPVLKSLIAGVSEIWHGEPHA